MPVKAHITDPATGMIAAVGTKLDGERRLKVDAVLDTINQVPLPVTFAIPGGTALPQMLTLWYSASVGAILANAYRRALTYTVPSGYNGYLIRYTSFQAESAQSRVISELYMGSLNIITNVFTGAGVVGTYTPPQWSGILQVEVTQVLGAASNIVVTVTYTNESGTSGRTGTIAIPKSSVVGSRFDLVLQAGDIGVRSIEGMSTDVTLASGAIKMLGFIQFSYHEDGGVVALETQFAPGATTFPEGTILGIEHQGGLVSKARRFDVLIQLVKIAGEV